MHYENNDDVLLTWFDYNNLSDDDEFLSQEDTVREESAEEDAEGVGLESQYATRRVVKLELILSAANGEREAASLNEEENGPATRATTATTDAQDLLRAKTEINEIIQRLDQLNWNDAEQEVTGCGCPERQELKRIAILRHEIQRLEAVMAELPPGYNTTDIQNEINVISNKLERINDIVDKEQAEQEASLLQGTIEPTSLTVVDEHRLEAVRESEPDMYKAIQWLRHNRYRFEQPVYLPLYLGINVNEERFTDVIEAVAGQALLKTFVCSTTEDYKVFKDEVIDSQCLCVNVIVLEDFRPPIPLQEAEAVPYASEKIDTESPAGSFTYNCGDIQHSRHMEG